MKKIFKKKYLIIGLCIVILSAIVGAIIFLQPVKADNVAFEEAKKNQDITIKDDGSNWVITPKSKSNADLIFYTGGLVEEKAYINNLSKVAAQETITIYIPKIFLNLAFFDIGAADKIIQKYKLDKIYVAGHSLGGVAACYYTKDHKDKVKGLIMMASYCDKPITDFKGDVLSIAGDQDGVINFNKKDEADKLLPENSQIALVPGMNHAQFGNYGKQRGDKDATIPNDQATQEILVQMQAINWGSNFEDFPAVENIQSVE